MTGSRTDLPTPGTSLAAPSEQALELQARMLAFLRDDVLPAEAESLAHRREAGPDGPVVPPLIERLTRSARERGLWNVFLPSGSGLTQLEYAPIAELAGGSNDLAPDEMGVVQQEIAESRLEIEPPALDRPGRARPVPAPAARTGQPVTCARRSAEPRS